MKKYVSILLVLAMLLSLTACSSGTTKSTTDAEEKTESAEGGEASGKLVIYSPNSDTQIEAQLDTFKEKYPDIEVELQSMGTGDVLARIEAEKENPQADVDWGAINYVYYTQHPDLWEEYYSPNEELVDENYKNSTGYFSNVNLSGSGCFILNNALLEELGVEVNGYADLLQPELKGKIAMGDPTASSSAWAELTNMLLVMGGYDSDEAWEYVEQFVENLDGIVLSSSSQVYKSVINGEYAVGVSYEDPCVQAIIDNKDNADADLSIVYPEEGAVWLPAGVAIVKDAPNMENAKLFLDWLLSEECQEILAETTIRGTITTIAQDNEYMKPLDEINVAYEDIEYCAEKQTEWLEKWTDILTR